MRVLLVEQDYSLAKAIKKVLEKNKYIVYIAVNGNEAWKFLTRGIEYTVAVFNLILPDLSGIDLIKKLRKNNYNLPILLLTFKNSTQDKVIGLDASADDYMVKSFRMPELSAILRALLRRSPYLILPQLKLGNLSLDYNTYTVSATGKESEHLVVLTAKEFQLLEYLMRHPGQIITSERFLAQIWSDRISLNSNLVAVHIGSLRKKLAIAKCNLLIETVYGVSYRLRNRS